MFLAERENWKICLCMRNIGNNFDLWVNGTIRFLYTSPKDQHPKRKLKLNRLCPTITTTMRQQFDLNSTVAKFLYGKILYCCSTRSRDYLSIYEKALSHEIQNKNTTSISLSIAYKTSVMVEKIFKSSQNSFEMKLEKKWNKCIVDFKIIQL